MQMMCEKKIVLGCENGALGKSASSAQVALNGAVRVGTPEAFAITTSNVKRNAATIRGRAEVVKYGGNGVIVFCFHKCELCCPIFSDQEASRAEH